MKSQDDLVLEAIRRHANGVSDADLAQDLGTTISLADRMQAINRLSSHKRIQFIQPATGAMLYKAVSAEEAAKFKGLGTEELMLYQIIRQSGNAGLWTKDMKSRTNLSQPTITKLLRNLETRNLVKAVTNVNNPSRKVYMLSELEPSRELTGGAWYTDNHFDKDFIETLRTVVRNFIYNQGTTTMRQIGAHIESKNVVTTRLALEDVSAIVNTLIYDGVVDEVGDEGDDGEELQYRPAMFMAPETTAFTSTPCGVCPVFHQCRDGGPVSPATCVYFDKWLDF